jgi:hypothetical protein
VSKPLRRDFIDLEDCGFIEPFQNTPLGLSRPTERQKRKNLA